MSMGLKPEDILRHKYIPKHEVLTDEEVKAVLEKYHATKEQLPKIKLSDPVVRALKAKPGDVIRIIRESETAGQSEYYRVVVQD